MRRIRRIRTVAVAPTMFTLGNLVCGFFAIVAASRIEAPSSPDVPTATKVRVEGRVMPKFDKTVESHNALLCGWLIFLAMIFDALDGQVARLARVTSDFGAQLDSLCDLVTFGVAPAFLMVKMCPSFAFLHPLGIWVIAASFAACAALRLARFNVETGETDDHSFFSGLPSPAAAAAIGSLAIMFHALRVRGNTVAYAAQIDYGIQYVLPFVTLMVAVLMVSRVPYPHIVNQLFRGDRSFGHVVGLLFAIVAIALVPGYSLPVLCLGFCLLPPAQFGWRRLQQRKSTKGSFFVIF